MFWAGKRIERLDASQVFKAQYEEIYYKDIQSIR